MITGYHFTGTTLRDGRPIPAIGEALIHDGPVEICRSGLHASRKASQALQYAPGNMLHRVACEDICDENSDKFVCRERTIIATIDAEYLMRRFAADQALSVSHLWHMPDVVRGYLHSLDPAARDAAWAASWDAWDAARAAARDAAWAAVRAAVRDAARGAARSAVSDAARDDFDARVESAFQEAINVDR